MPYAFSVATRRSVSSTKTGFPLRTTTITTVVKINLVRYSVLLYAKAEALLYGCCVRVGIPDQERYYTVGPGIKEHRQPWPDCPGSVCTLDEHIHKMMV